MDGIQFKWKENDKFLQEVWDSEHELLLKKIEEKFQKYVDQWVNSSAGEAFVEMINVSRYVLLQGSSNYRTSKVKMPTLVVGAGWFMIFLHQSELSHSNT